MDIQKHDSIRKKHGTNKLRRKSTAIDMTPMVDLAFLLLTFFILTTSFGNHMKIDVQVPDNAPTMHPSKISELQAFNLILLNNDSVLWYIGDEDKIATAQISTFSENNMQTILNDHNSLVNNAISLIKDSVLKGLIKNTPAEIKKHIELAKSNKNALVVLIKNNQNVKYNSLVKTFDIINLCNVGRYAMMDLGKKERAYLHLN